MIREVQKKRIVVIMMLALALSLLPAAALPSSALQTTKEVFVIDENVDNSAEIANRISEDGKVIFISDDTDGFSQICAGLSGENDLSAIHIVSHGSQGKLHLGSSVLSMDTLDSYRAQLTAIGDSLGNNGDLLIYGCEVAKGAEGKKFIREISDITGADVAASDDVTSGNSEKGNSDLEVHTGIIGSQKIDFDGWNGILGDTSLTAGLNAEITLYPEDLGYESGFASAGYTAIYIESLPETNGMLGIGEASNSLRVSYSYSKTTLDGGVIKFKATAQGVYTFGVSWEGNTSLYEGSKIPPVSPEYTITITVTNPVPTGITLSNSNAPAGYEGLRIGRLTGVDNTDDTNTFSIVSDPSDLFEVSTDSASKRQGILSFQAGKTLAVDETASVTVRVTDSVDNTFNKTFTIRGVEPTLYEISPSDSVDFTYSASISSESEYLPPESGKGTMKCNDEIFNTGYVDVQTYMADWDGFASATDFRYIADSAEGQDSFAIGTEYYVIAVSASIAFSSTTLDDATYMSSYSKVIDPATGGSGTYTYSITEGAFPTGISFNSTTRTISGTPTGNAGTYAFTITAVDSTDSSKSQSAEFNLVVAKATPTVSAWPAISEIKYGQTYGDAMGSDGNSSVSGAFSIANASTVPGAVGSPYTKTVTFTPDDINYSTVTTSVTITVNKANAAISEISCDDKTYDGNALSPSASITIGDGSIVYTYSGSGIAGSTTTAPSAAGTYMITATLAATSNYNEAAKTKSISIFKADQNSFAIIDKPSSPAYGDTFTLDTTGELGTGSLSWNAAGGASVTAAGEVTITGMSEVTITATKVGDDNYNAAASTYVFTPAKANPALGTVSAADLFVGEALSISGLTRTNETVGGTLSWDTNPGFSSASAGSVLATYVFTPAQTDQYKTVTGQVSITINTKKIISVSAQTAIVDKSYGTAQSALGLPASIEVAASGRGGSETKTVSVSWSGYDSHLMIEQTLTGTIDLTGNAELNNSDSLTASISVTLQPTETKNISNVSAKIKIGSTDGIDLLKELVTSQFDESVDAAATDADGWTGFPSDYDTATVSTRSFTVQVKYVDGGTAASQDVTISYDIVNPTSLAYTTSTITIDADDTGNASESSLLDYVNGFRSLTAAWPDGSIGNSVLAASVEEYASLPVSYVKTGTVYTFSQSYLGQVLTQTLTVNEVKMDQPNLTVDYSSEKINTTDAMEYRVGSGSWNSCSDNMAVTAWLGNTVSFKTAADGYKVESLPMEITFPDRETAPDALSATINDDNTEIIVMGLTDGITYEYSMDGTHYTELLATGVINAAAYQNHISIRKMDAAASFHSEAAEVAVNYTMIFQTGEGTAISNVYAVSGASVAAPTAPDRTGYIFDGWFSTSEYTSGSGVVFPYTMTGNYTIYAKWKAQSHGSSSSSKKTDQPASASQAVLEVNGKSQNAGTTESETNSAGQTQTTVTVDTGKLQDILDQQRKNATVTIPITTGSDIAAGVLTGAMVDSMEQNGATLVIQTGRSVYTLPAEEINITAVSEQFGKNVSLSDIAVKVEISEPSNETAAVVKNASDEGGFSIVVPAVEFTISCEHEERTVAVSSFNSYVERLIAIPDGADHKKITTGIVVKPDGTTSHVPTQIVEIDGVYYAKINSLTNSTYTVIWHPVAFADTEKHWAREAINDMGSRMIVYGDQNGNYKPGSDMTRAEFATTIVRALGLSQGTGSSNFRDVKASDWYSGYIKTAVAYGLIEGYSDGTFNPKGLITREQAMAIIARAMKITGLEISLTERESSALLGDYSDGTAVSNYAADSIAECLKAEVVSGTSNHLIAPKKCVTRAEVAVMVKNLLQRSKLI